MENYRALVVRKIKGKKFTRQVEELSVEALPRRGILIRVMFSSLNYKDALSSVGHPGVTRVFPHTPGIDAAGFVASSTSKKFKEGDSVIVVGRELGTNSPGGFGQYINVPEDWVMSLPDGVTLRESMLWGTAGFTAGLSILNIINHGIMPFRGPVVVTGATGGVGICSLSILSQIGYSVIVSTGKLTAHKLLKDLGADTIINREEVNISLNRPMFKERWVAGIDNLGGNALSTLIKSCKSNGIIISVGLVVSPDLITSVTPLILRGVTIKGINAQGSSEEIRKEIWSKLAGDWKHESINLVETMCTLDNLNPVIDKVLRGDQIGRVVVDLT